MKQILLLIAGIVFISGNTYSQSRIRGIVKDSKTNVNLSGVSVYMPDIKKVVETNKDGEFIVDNVPRGILSFQYSLAGYNSISSKIQISRRNISLNIRLEPADISSEEALVTETSVESPYQTDYISSRDLQKDGSMNVSESVSKLPGVWQFSTGEGVSKPVIRGLYGNRVGIEINGMRFDNQQWRDDHGLILSMDGIDKIEIIKGPMSLKYGPEAIGGIMKIIQENPAPTGKNVADFNLKLFSNTLGISSNAGFRGAGKNYYWKLRFGGESNSDYLDGDGNKIPNTRFGGYDIQGSTGINKKWFSSNIDYIYTSYTYGILDENYFLTGLEKNENRSERSFTGPHQSLDVQNFALKNNFFAGKSKIIINLGYVSNQRLETQGDADKLLPDSLQYENSDLLLKTLSYDASWTYPVSKKVIIGFGSQGFTQKNRNEGQRMILPDANSDQIAVSGTIKYENNDYLFEGGLRYDIFKIKTFEHSSADSINYPPLDLNFNVFNGSIGLTNRVSKYLLLKGNLSSGYRAPSLAELTSGGYNEVSQRYEIGNNNFKSEQSFSGDLGFIVETNDFSINFSAFNNALNNFIYLKQTDEMINGDSVSRYYQSNAAMKGFEADLIIKPAKWFSVEAAYSTVTGKLNSGEYIPLMPADKISYTLSSEFSKLSVFGGYIYRPSVEVSGYTAFAQSKLAPGEFTTGSYSLLNLTFGGNLKLQNQFINLYLIFNNLLNETYRDFLSGLKKLSADYNGRSVYANNMGRNIVISLKIPFNLPY